MGYDIMIKSFTISKEVNIEEMLKKVEDMYRLLDEFSEGNLPNENYTLDDLKEFCRSLVEGQQNDIEGIKPGSWCVAPDGRMPGDARVDFAFFPTYIAISILTKVLTDYPEIAESIPNYNTVLKKGYVFATYRKLQGHGYESEIERIKAIKILEKGGVIEFIEKNPSFSPSMYNMLDRIRIELIENIMNESTYNAWGQNYDYESVGGFILSPKIIKRYNEETNDFRTLLRYARTLSRLSDMMLEPLYRKLFNIAESFEDFIIIASLSDRFSQIFGYNVIETVYPKLFDLAETFEQLMRIASLSKVFDYDMLEPVYLKLICMAEDFEALMRIALLPGEFKYDVLEPVYLKLIYMSEDFETLIQIGSVLNKKFAKKVKKKIVEEIFNKGERKAKSAIDFCNLAHTVSLMTDEQIYVRELYEKAEKSAYEIKEKRQVANRIMSVLKDKKWGKRILREIGDIKKEH